MITGFYAGPKEKSKNRKFVFNTNVWFKMYDLINELVFIAKIRTHNHKQQYGGFIIIT